MKNKNKCLSFRRVIGDNKNNRTRKANSSKFLVFSLMTVFLVFSLLCLFQVTDQTVTGFMQQDFGKELSRLKKDNEDLNIQAMRLSQINQVNMNSMGMIKVVQMEYLEQQVGGSVAMAR